MTLLLLPSSTSMILEFGISSKSQLISSPGDRNKPQIS